ncbi:uncharacterized protein LOC110176996 isoform X2 [Drosophila serrata]|uniref:uncharacterized protein LOC110176996 isoform X2 n=1 Tax=Drosophila serrata TaxID=7274 RepID=UPI000A1CFB13|nr:uncharacterized protein LOC110176996 isoform X2 [Drosophila serrata]
MDKHNKYRGDVREHFLGTRNEPKRDKNGHRIPMDDDRPHRETLHYRENAIFSTHAFLNQPRDNSFECLNCTSCRGSHSQYDVRGHRSPPDMAPIKLSRNNDHDYQYHHEQPQKHCPFHEARKPSHNTRNTHRYTDPGIEKTEVHDDLLVYKNSTYRETTSDRVGDERQEPAAPANDYSHKHYQTKEPYPPHKDYEKARAHCLAADERLREKYSFLSDDSITSKKSKPSQNTIISAKSGKDLRSLIRSQIHLQQALDHSLTHADRRTPPSDVDKKETGKVSGLEKGTPTILNKPKTPKRHPEDVSEEAELKSSPIDLTALFCVSADDIVSAKVIEPMIRKIQRMYLTTLQEEMSIMDYLGEVPKLVSEVYRETAQRDSRKSSDLK